MASPPAAASSASPTPHHSRLRFRRYLRPPPPRLPPASSSASSSRRPSALQESQFRSIASRPVRNRAPIQIATAFDEDLGDFSLVHDDGDEAFGVVLYSNESEWSDEDVVLNPIGDVELPVISKNRFEGAEGVINVAAHMLASIEKGHRKSRLEEVTILQHLLDKWKISVVNSKWLYLHESYTIIGIWLGVKVLLQWIA